MKVKLHDFFGGGIRKLCLKSLDGGKGYTNVSYLFEPGKIYEFDDPVLKQFFKGEVGNVNETMVSTPELVSQLKYYGVSYTTKKCGTCSSAKPKVVFNPFVIVEE